MQASNKIRRCTKLMPLLLLSLCNSGCYYMQAAAGQWQVMRKSEPINEVLNEADTTDELAEQLRVVQAARRFSIEELGLPDNNSYRNYADIERDYVVWNVFAAPEFSLQPKRWCFPVAGCVSYRGYFSREAAVRKSEQLARRGYDVAVGGVSAYSTLGKFADPVLSSMLSWDDTQLVGVLFHELAHQVLYVKGDSAFNESFATAVEEFGLDRWLDANERSGDIDAYRERRQLRRRLMLLVADARNDLRQYYAADIYGDEKRRLKAARLDRLSSEARAMLVEAGRNASGWLAGELNNAKLVSMTLYEGHLPSFRALLVQCEQDIRCFYAKALELSRLDKPERDRRLAKLAQS